MCMACASRLNRLHPEFTTKRQKRETSQVLDNEALPLPLGSNVAENNDDSARQLRKRIRTGSATGVTWACSSCSVASAPAPTQSTGIHDGWSSISSSGPANCQPAPEDHQPTAPPDPYFAGASSGTQVGNLQSASTGSGLGTTVTITKVTSLMAQHIASQGVPDVTQDCYTYTATVVLPNGQVVPATAMITHQQASEITGLFLQRGAGALCKELNRDKTHKAAVAEVSLKPGHAESNTDDNGHSIDFSVESFREVCDRVAPDLFQAVQRGFVSTKGEKKGRTEESADVRTMTALCMMTYSQNRECNSFQSALATVVCPPGTSKTTARALNKASCLFSFHSLTLSLVSPWSA